MSISISVYVRILNDLKQILPLLFRHQTCLFLIGIDTEFWWKKVLLAFFANISNYHHCLHHSVFTKFWLGKLLYEIHPHNESCFNRREWALFPGKSVRPYYISQKPLNWALNLMKIIKSWKMQNCCDRHIGKELSTHEFIIFFFYNSHYPILSWVGTKFYPIWCGGLET